MSDLRVEVKGKPGRCAYCHDDVVVDERTACAACLAVHHDECWERDAKCASCGEKRSLGRSAARMTSSTLEARTAQIGLAVIEGDKLALTKAIIRTTPRYKERTFRLQLAAVVTFMVGALALLVAPGAAILCAILAFLALALTYQLSVQNPAAKEARALRESVTALAAGRLRPEKEPPS